MSEITTENSKYRDKDQLDTLENIKNLYDSKENVIELYNDYAKIVSEAMYRAKYGTWLKILTPKQILQRLPIALAQVKAGNNSENLLSENRQIVYSKYQSKETTKKVYINIIKSIHNTSEPRLLIFKLANKLDLTRGEKIVSLSNFSITIHGKT